MNPLDFLFSSSLEPLYVDVQPLDAAMQPIDPLRYVARREAAIAALGARWCLARKEPCNDQ